MASVDKNDGNDEGNDDGDDDINDSDIHDACINNANIKCRSLTRRKKKN